MTDRLRLWWYRVRLRCSEIVSAERRVAAARAEMKKAEKRAYDAHVAAATYRTEAEICKALMHNMAADSARGMLELQRRLDRYEGRSEQFWDEHLRRRPID